MTATTGIDEPRRYSKLTTEKPSSSRWPRSANSRSARPLARDTTEAEALVPFRAFDVRPFTPEHVYHVAGIEANPRPRGEYHDDLATDIGIGGVARALGVSVLTRNVTDFERFDAVNIESY
ncbi:hypothetical protein BRC68_06330 [Halobacteriales archaeon QH_6_64_20]|nr:MAG: hypothetical protein BRC68_06330 [Halobacteriales archaeon QH_6_64_20]